MVGSALEDIDTHFEKLRRLLYFAYVDEPCYLSLSQLDTRNSYEPTRRFRAIAIL